MWFQRIQEITEAPTTSNVFLNTTTSASVPSEFEQKSEKRKSMPELQEDNMRLFKRVRLMERIFQQDVDILKDNHGGSEVQSRSQKRLRGRAFSMPGPAYAFSKEINFESDFRHLLEVDRPTVSSRASPDADYDSDPHFPFGEADSTSSQSETARLLDRGASASPSLLNLFPKSSYVL